MRYECDDKEFSGCYLEISERWTVGERNRFFATEGTGDDFLSLLRTKVTSMRLVDIEGNVLDDPEGLTLAGLENIDARLFDWLIQTVPLAVIKVGALGEPMRRRLWDTYGKIKTPKTPTAADSPLDA